MPLLEQDDATRALADAAISLPGALARVATDIKTEEPITKKSPIPNKTGTRRFATR